MGHVHDTGDSIVGIETRRESMYVYVQPMEHIVAYEDGRIEITYEAMRELLRHVEENAAIRKCIGLEGTREPGEEGVGIPLPGETMWDAGYAQCMHDFEIPGPDGSIPESRLPAPPIQGETDG